MSIYASCLHQKEVHCYAKSLTKNSTEKPKSPDKKQTSTFLPELVKSGGTLSFLMTSLSVQYFIPFPK